MKIRPIRKNEVSDASKIIGMNYSKNKEYQKRSKLEIGSVFKSHPFSPKFLAMEDKGKLIGFAGYMQSSIDYNIYEVFWVNISPDHQNKGLGTILVKQVIEKIRKSKEAEYITLTARNPAFYEKFGFKKLHMLDKERALMILDLKA